jgi:hypothetical protein
MNPSHSLATALLGLAALGTTTSAADKPTRRMAARGPAKLQPASGLQTAPGLATSSIDGSGANPVAEKLSDDAWRKLFPIKKTAGQ